ncbi:hypothetical protein BP00DRAFT_458537 [Aspergillus indologenus CBS 114.80]|uniref:Glycine zipper 2TM domain-containing protein n=1 Tax=Aspergillus indologenus CBS 114.80 TaxID=1450541 RepID=A0A2V5HYQ6_9EURO|nr:hypothetical protein BP00DRAFT_458537 [Aspergillus indologenus CBS 114.80]
MGDPYSTSTASPPPPAQQQYDYDYNYNYNYNAPPPTSSSSSAYHDQYPQHYGHTSQYDISPIPRSHPDDAGGALVPAPAPEQQQYHDYDHDRLGPQYAPPPPPPGYGIVRQGSNAEYYDQSHHDDLSQSHNPLPSQRDDEGVDPESTDRGLGGAILGGTSGYYLGHKKSHGLLGAVGGAILGSLMENRLKGAGRKEDHGGAGGGDGGSTYVMVIAIAIVIVIAIAIVIVITGMSMGMGMGIITIIITIGIIGIGIIGDDEENDDNAVWDITIVAAGALQQISATWTLVRWLDRNLGARGTSCHDQIYPR